MKIRQIRKEPPDDEQQLRIRRLGHTGLRRLTDLELVLLLPSSKAERAKRRRARRARRCQPQMLPEPTPRPDQNCPEWHALKRQVIKEERRCRKCGTYRRLTVDHIVPLAKGGGNHRANLQCLCKLCNKQKGCQLPAPAPSFYLTRRAA